MILTVPLTSVRFPLFPWDFFPWDFSRSVIPVTYKLVLRWLLSQAPGVTGSVLGLVGPVSAYCDWVRQ